MRAPGYYWVSYDASQPEIAYWDGSYWNFCGTDDGALGDSLIEVLSGRLERPQ